MGGRPLQPPAKRDAPTKALHHRSSQAIPLPIPPVRLLRVIVTTAPYDVFDPGDHLGGSRKVDTYLCRSRSHKGMVACKVLRAPNTIDYS